LIILSFVFTFLFTQNASSSESLFDDYGIISIMYHRFDENKYPSTNIRMNDFTNHIKMIQEQNIKFINPSNFLQELRDNKKTRKVLVTVDDGFMSFYKNAWPLLRSKQIPFILFISTREVGKAGYMNWNHIREISKTDFAYIGNHSHSHEYLIDEAPSLIREDLIKSKNIFKKELGKNSNFFSYPFGEYSNELKNITADLGFTYAFGQHSGVIDETKNYLELPRFPINEKYGKIDRFKTILKTLPLKFTKIYPDEKYINNKTNPPKVKIEFSNNLYPLDRINCFSNEEDKWRNSKIQITDNKFLTIKLDGKFTTERGRINCSLQEKNGYYRWLGMQFVVAEK
tara:strand:- start:1470 stop:2495 length:1026 start_codon:yes stop_codon:yes gene_type:complete